MIDRRVLLLWDGMRFIGIVEWCANLYCYTKKVAYSRKFDHCNCKGKKRNMLVGEIVESYCLVWWLTFILGDNRAKGCGGCGLAPFADLYYWKWKVILRYRGVKVRVTFF